MIKMPFKSGCLSEELHMVNDCFSAVTAEWCIFICCLRRFCC